MMILIRGIAVTACAAWAVACARSPTPFEWDSDLTAAASPREVPAALAATALESPAVRGPACVSNFDCLGQDRPVCENFVCVASPHRCAGDDPADRGLTDDGPSTARKLSAPTPGRPTTATGRMCGTLRELDYFVFESEANQEYVVTLTHDNAGNLNWQAHDSSGAVLLLEYGRKYSPLVRRFRVERGGKIYLAVTTEYGKTPTTSYQLELAVPGCTRNAECGADTPVCEQGRCMAWSVCDADDDGEPRDDAPRGGRDLTGAPDRPVTQTGLICDIADEADFYNVTVDDGDHLELELDWKGDQDIDLRVLAPGSDDNLLRPYGEASWQHPQRVTLSYLPAGTYVIHVATEWLTLQDLETEQSSASVPYSLTVTRRRSAGCSTLADCAAESITQRFRGSCSARTGACERVDGAGQLPLGSTCDSSDDCSSEICYGPRYAQDAHQSHVCAALGCETDADCPSRPPGLDPLRCLIVEPGEPGACLVPCTSDAQCGAAIFEPPPPGATWARGTCDLETGVCQ